ncbi:MAG: RsbRD N-terminal domain-containing protein [Deltaproteobacteria bacterium]|nr:RsbRD N-terminal domain-containing protein [Deltaproteobacteria bacterium]
MTFWELLEKRRADILARWQESVFAGYPADSSGFLTKQNDQFANPVGVRIKQGLDQVIRVMLAPTDHVAESEAMNFLDDIMHIRAVQDFSAAKALRFIFDLKDVVREVLSKDLKKFTEETDWHSLDRRIDSLGLIGFEIYSRCREKIFEIRVNEVKNLSYKAMKRAKLLCEIEGLEPGPSKDAGCCGK